MRLHTGAVRTRKGAALKVDRGRGREGGKRKEKVLPHRGFESASVLRRAFQSAAVPGELFLPLVGLYRQRKHVRRWYRPPTPGGCTHQTGLIQNFYCLQNSRVKSIFPNQVIVQLQLNLKKGSIVWSHCSFLHLSPRYNRNG